MTKTCTKCGVTKSFDEFHARTASPDGKHCYCKPCNTAAAGAWAQRNKESRRASTRAYTYQISHDQAKSLGSVFTCPVCCRTEQDTGYRHHVDHDHVTGQVRAVLCRGCNLALGNLEEDPERMRRLAAYIEAHTQTHPSYLATR